MSAAEAAGFGVLITTDQNLRYQQNLANRRLAVVVLSTADWRRIRQRVDGVTEAIASTRLGDYVEFYIPSS